jgi:hypothetical protein
MFGLIMESVLLIIVYFILIFNLIYFIFLYYLNSGIFSNLSTSYSAIYYSSGNRSSADGVIVNNCTFEHLRSNYTYAPAIYFNGSYSTLNITECIFNNVSGSYIDSNGGAIYYYMSSSYTYLGYYNISGNIFINISTTKSTIHFLGTFKTLTFSNNSFRNILISSSGGVFINF